MKKTIGKTMTRLVVVMAILATMIAGFYGYCLTRAVEKWKDENAPKYYKDKVVSYFVDEELVEAKFVDFGVIEVSSQTTDKFVGHVWNQNTTRYSVKDLF